MVERFIEAAKEGFIDLLRQATRKDLNTPDEDGMTATLWAAERGQLEALRLIVGREGDVNKSDYYGMTALHHAAMRGHLNVVSFLVHWGCNVFAVDNDHQSALQLAEMNNHAEIVKFLDSDIAQKQSKNPRQVTRLKMEATKAAENNIKRYEKMQDAAAKRLEKEQESLQKERGQQNTQTTRSGQYAKKSIFNTLTIRVKGVFQGNSVDKSRPSYTSSSYSQMAGFSHTVSSANRRGIAKKIPLNNRNSKEMTYRGIDDRGNSTIRSLGPGQGISGPTSDIVYVKDAETGSEQNNLGLARRTPLWGNNIYKAKSESDLLDSGVDSLPGEEDDEEVPSMFNRPQFGKLSFFPNSHFQHTVQSFDDTSLPATTNGVNGDLQRLSGDREEIMKPEPWDQDELGNLDDDEDDNDLNEFSAVNMFLWSCGLANYLHIFTQEKLDMALLTQLTDAELKELGLPLGPRKRLREAIANRKNVMETPSKMTDTYL